MSDYSGHVIETVVDLASIGWSLTAFLKAPSWINLGYLFWDIGATFIPCVPGSYVYKGVKLGVKLGSKTGKVAVKVASSTSDFRKGYKKCLVIGKYKGLRKMFKGVKGVEVHHVIEKRFAVLFKPGANDFMSVPMERGLHQLITNRWRQQFAYGYNYRKITKAQMKKAINNVYKDMPELKALALKWLDQNWKG